MRILITSFGVRGDVQPYLALAVGLQRAGHSVTLATSHNFAEWIQRYGVGCHPVRFSMAAYAQTPEAQSVIRSKNPLRIFRLFRHMMRQVAEAQDDVWSAIQEADFVVQSPTSSGALEAVALRNIPAAFAVPVPFAPTSAFPSFFMGSLRQSLGPTYNRLTHRLMHLILWRAMSGPITNPLRKRLGLRPWRSYGELLADCQRLGVPWLNGFSGHVLARPSDWAENQHITGYWFLDAPPDWQPSPDLTRFLESGPPPVYIGFGSMSHGDPAHQTRLVLRALALSGQRGVLATGWGGISQQDTPADVFVVESVPHRWLFPRMAAVVHHGGAGTTGAGLAAGIPNIITPFASNDQPAWAERVEALGVGTRLSPVKKLSAEELAQAIRQAATDSHMRARAGALGKQIQAEDGVGNAIALLERYAVGFGRSG